MRIALAKRREEARRRLRRRRGDAPPGQTEGELLTELAGRVRMVEVSKIRKDPRFHVVRVHDDPLHAEWASNEGQHKSDLLTAMEADGMKNPITVAAADENEEDLILIAGERRWSSARELGWQKIPAIVLPCWVPEEALYTANLADLTRKMHTTYEAACAARRFRDDLGVSPAEFCRRTGYSQAHVSNLLGCLDRLPPYLVEQWRDGARLSLDQWLGLSYLEPEQALRTFRKLTGMSPGERMKKALARGRKHRLPPRWCLERMIRLYEGVAGSDLPPRTRDLVLRVIEFCQNAVDDIPGVYDPKKQKKYAERAKMRSELALPDFPAHPAGGGAPGSNRQDTPPPIDDQGDDDDEDGSDDPDLETPGPGRPDDQQGRSGEREERRSRPHEETWDRRRGPSRPLQSSRDERGLDQGRGAGALERPAAGRHGGDFEDQEGR